MPDPQLDGAPDPQQGQQPPANTPPTSGSSPVTFDSQPIQQPPTGDNPAGGTGQVTFDTQPISSPPASGGILQHAKDVGKGFAKGAMSTVAGLDDMVSKIPGVGKWLTTPLAGGDTSQQAINNEEQESQTHNTAQKIGYGGETLAEFMLGDEALKGLSMADRLASVSKTMKILEKSPRVIKALQVGADAALHNGVVRAGIDTAARSGIVQGAQTLARTGGDVKEAATDAATAGVTGGVLGAAGHVVGGAISNIGKAGGAAQRLGDAAGSASTKEEVAKAVGDKINNNERALHTEYEAGIQDLSKRLGDTEVSAQKNPIADRAKTLLSEPNPEDHPIVGQAKQAAGEQLDKPVRDLLESISSGKLPVTEEDVEAAAEANKPSGLVDEHDNPIQSEPIEPEGKDAPPYKVNDLVQLRQTIRNLADGYQYGDVNSRALRSLINGTGDTVSPVDQTIEQLAKQSGDATATQDYLNLRNNYRSQINAFDEPVISKLREGKMDDAARDFVGVTPKGDALPKAGKVRYNTDQLRTVLGPDGLKEFGSQVFGTMLQDSVENGHFNPAKFANTLGRVSQETKGDLFDAGKVDYGLQQLMGDTKSAAMVQHLTRLGVLSAATSAGAALAATGTAGEFAGVSLASMLGLTVAEGGGIAKGRELLDVIANHPKMWAFYRGLGKVADSSAVQTAAKTGRQVATSAAASPSPEDTKKRVYQSVANSFSAPTTSPIGRQRQSDKVVVPADTGRGVGEVKLPVLTPAQQ